MTLISTVLLVLILPLQDPVELLLDRGFDLYEESEYEAALEVFNKAMKLSPENAEVHLFRGLCLHGMLEVEKSIEAMQQAIKLDPNYLEAYQEMGYIYLVGQAPKEAIEAYDKAISIDPANATLYVNRGTAKCMNNDKSGAVSDWIRARELGADYSELMTCE